MHAASHAREVGTKDAGAIDKTKRRRPAATLVVALAVAVTGPAAAAGPNSASGPPAAGNPVPDVVPAIREWRGGRGMLELGAHSRIVVDSSNADQLADEAAGFRADLDVISGLALPVEAGSRGRRGDVFLSLDGSDRGLGEEGYRLRISDRLEITAGTDAGLFYGTQTVLQTLRIAESHRELPRGEARDWPRYSERGVMLDVGRKYWSPDYLVQAIREMAYLRLNTLHLHLADNNAFRLVSDRFPYLAAPQAYTKADLVRFEAAAAKYHVTIVPEIDLPSHSQSVLDARPDLRFECSEFREGYTLDVTNPRAREFAAALIDEFAPLFSGPEFHIGTDEYEVQARQERCPELVQYAEEHGFGSTADVFVDFINEMNGVVRSHGKRMVIWNWWDIQQSPTIHPDKSIKVQAWTAGPEPYLDQGYDVVASPSNLVYITPQFPLLPDARFLYEEWTPLDHPRLTGYQIAVWTDNAFTRPDGYFDAYLRRPREVVADRLWGGPRRGSAADFFARANAIGVPPGAPEYALPDKLTGTPFGKGPASDESTTFDKAFDGDPITMYDDAEENGGYTGIDLGSGRESAVSLVRFFPRAPFEMFLRRMVGGRFEGCTGGPTDGCVTLATVETEPSFGWNEIPIANPAPFRWLRYVGPDGGFGNVAEIEFYAPPSDSRQVSVQASPELHHLGDNRIVTTYRNAGDGPVYDVRVSLAAYARHDRAALDVRSLEAARFAVVRPGEEVSTAWHVDVPLSAASGAYRMVARAGYQEQPEAVEPRLDSGAVALAELGPVLTWSFDPEVVELEEDGADKTTELRLSNHAARPIAVAWREVRPPAASPHLTIRPTNGAVMIPAGGTSSETITAVASTPTAGGLRLDLDASTSGAGPHAQVGSTQVFASPPPPAGESYLSDLGWIEAFSSFQYVSRDASVGWYLPITLNGVTYEKGVSTAAPSRVSYYLARRCSRVAATIGIDDAVDYTSENGTAVFQVFVDGTKVYDSGLITREDVEDIDVDVTGANVVSLVAEHGGDGSWPYLDQADWADVKVDCL